MEEGVSLTCCAASFNIKPFQGYMNTPDFPELLKSQESSQKVYSITMADKRPLFVILPGASQNTAHCGYLCHLLQLAGYAVFSALLLSIGAAGEVTIEDDSAYIRNSMFISILDYEKHDVILGMHSYSSMPGSAAAKGLGKTERTSQGKSTSVIGQIRVAALLAKGGDRTSVLGAFGGHYPPHIRPDGSNLLLIQSN
jgi:hypothetical protein